MKVTLTVEIIPVTKVKNQNRWILPEDLAETVRKMTASEAEGKSIMSIDGYPPSLIDNRAVSRYYPMAIERTFLEALELIKGSCALAMTRGHLTVSYGDGTYFVGGKSWVPLPEDILSQQKEWYVHVKDQPVVTR